VNAHNLQKAYKRKAWHSSLQGKEGKRRVTDAGRDTMHYD